MKSIYMFDVTNAEGRNVQWYADMKKTGKIGKGRPPSKPQVRRRAPLGLTCQVTIKISDRDLVDLATGTVRRADWTVAHAAGQSAAPLRRAAHQGPRQRRHRSPRRADHHARARQGQRDRGRRASDEEQEDGRPLLLGRAEQAVDMSRVALLTVRVYAFIGHDLHGQRDDRTDGG